MPDMELSEYLRKGTKEQREALAIKSGTTVDYLYQIAGKHRLCGGKLALRIAANCNPRVGRVRAASIRPDLFGMTKQRAA